MHSVGSVCRLSFEQRSVTMRGRGSSGLSGYCSSGNTVAVEMKTGCLTLGILLI